MSTGEPTEAHIALDLSDVHKSLRELWASEALADAPVVRAQTHNLVVCGSASEGGNAVEMAIGLVATSQGRVIVVDSGPGDPKLGGEASVFCRVEGNKQVCGELITLRARGSGRDEAHSLVASLLLPDLPVYVWWQGMPPQGDHLFEELVKLADQVYFDSNTFTHPTGGLTAMAALEGIAVGDLNWRRLTGWRQLVAQLYDVPDRQESLRFVRSIDVHYIANTEPYNPNRALLFVGWLAARLNWTLEEARIGKTGGYIFQFRSEAQPVKVEVVEGHATNVDKGELTGVFVVAGSTSPYLMPRLVLGEDCDCLEIRVDTSLEARQTTAPLHVIPYTMPGPASLLAEALLAGGDPDFERALKTTGELVLAIT